MTITPFHKTVASVLGLGYIKVGAGTIASGTCALAWYLIQSQQNFTAMVIITGAITLLGIWSASAMERVWGHDNRRVVIDEVAGMSISLLFLPVNWALYLAAFVLFRYLDITKPFYIAELEKLKGGWGVMLDDVLAGVYTNLLIQLFLRWNSL